MLKNKFGMLKVLALALSVLMLVSLVACGNEGMSDDEIQAAIDAAVSANKAEQDAAAADAAAKAEAAAQAAAEKAASEAKAQAEAAEKAASEAASKAAAAEAAAKAEASKAAESASKAAAEAAAAAKKAEEEAKSVAASISKSAAEAAKTTTAPVAVVDKTELQAEFAKLKHEYTYTNEGLYLADNYAELVLLFDKAAVELQNAATIEAAQSVVESVKVAAAAIENVQNRADAVQTLIAELGDIESEVFTTQAEKIAAAKDAYKALKVDYDDYLDYDVEEKADGAKTVKIATNLGINVADLNKASAKLVVLEEYIQEALWDDMETLYKSDMKGRFDAEDDYTGAMADLIDGMYYKYLVLSVINGTDTAAADLPIDWEYDVDDKGEYIEAAEDAKHPITGKSLKYELDFDAPTDFFPVETLLETYILPSLNVRFNEIKGDALTALQGKLNEERYDAIVAKTNNVPGTSIEIVADWSDIKDVFEETVDAFEVELDTLSFTGDYKGNVTLAGATEDLYYRYMKAYINGINAIIAASKENAIEIYEENVLSVKIEALEDQYEDEKYAETLAAKVARENEKFDTLVANIEAVPSYDYDALNAEDIRDDYVTGKDVAPALDEYYDDGVVADGFYTYVDAIIVKTINKYFAVSGASAGSTEQAGLLGDVVIAMTDDLLALRDRLDPTNENADLYLDNLGRELTSMKATAELEGYVGDKYYANTPKFLELIAKIDATIEALEAIDETTYADKDITLKVPDAEGTYGSKNYKQPVYWASESTKAQAMAEADGDQAALEALVIKYLKEEVAYRKVAEGQSDTKKISKITDGDMVTLTNTGLPITYVRTATEQACVDAHTLYNTLYSDVHTAILAMNGVVDAYKADIAATVKKVTDKTSTNAALKAELEAFGELYKGYGATYTALKYAFSASAGTNSYVTSVSTSDYLSATHFTSREATLGNNSTNYLKADDGDTTANLVDDLGEYEAIFELTFGTDLASSTIVDLWNYKTAIVAELTALKNSYKNNYTTTSVIENGLLVNKVVKTATTRFEYDADATDKASTKGAAYEAQIDALFESYIAKIEAVTLSTVAQVKNAAGTEILKKYDKKVFDVDGNGAISGANETIEKVTFNIAAAKNLINAYVVDLVGYDVALEAGIVITDPSVQDLTAQSGYELKNYETSMGRIEKAWNIYIMDNYN